MLVGGCFGFRMHPVPSEPGVGPLRGTLKPATVES